MVKMRTKNCCIVARRCLNPATCTIDNCKIGMILTGQQNVFQQRKNQGLGLPVLVDHASHAEVADGARVDQLDSLAMPSHWVRESVIFLISENHLFRSVSGKYSKISEKPPIDG